MAFRAQIVASLSGDLDRIDGRRKRGGDAALLLHQLEQIPTGDIAQAVQKQAIRARLINHLEGPESAFGALDMSCKQAHNAGIVSQEEQDLMMMLMLLPERGASLSQVRQRLEEDHLRLVGEALADVPYYLGHAAYKGHDLYLARQLATQALQRATELDIKLIRYAAASLLGTILAEMGEGHEARKQLDDARQAARAYYASDAQGLQGALEILEDNESWADLQALMAQAEAERDGEALPETSPKAVQNKVVQGLDALLQRYRGKCHDDACEGQLLLESRQDVARVRRNRARALVLVGRPEEAQKDLQQAHMLDPQPEVSERLEDLEIRAAIHHRAALLKRVPSGGPGPEGDSHRHFSLAISGYEEMRSLACDKLAAPGWCWRSLVKLAAAQKDSGDDEAALKTYWAAEEVLVHPELALPITSIPDGTRTVGPSVEWGATAEYRSRWTRRHLQLLLDRDLRSEALKLVLKVHGRRMLASQLRHAIAGATGEKLREWQTFLDEYRRKRSALDQAVLNAIPARPDEASAQVLNRSDHRSPDEPARARQDLASLLQTKLNEIAPQDRHKEEEHSPDPDDLMLTCHPILQMRWVCLLRSGSQIQIAYLGDEMAHADQQWLDAQRRERDSLNMPGLSADQFAERLAKLLRQAREIYRPIGDDLLRRFAPWLREGSRLRVLPIGGLRYVDFISHPWPNGDGSLVVDHLTVVQVANLGAQATDEEQRVQALLVIDPKGNFPAARQMGPRVAEALSRTFRVLPFGVGVPTVGKVPSAIGSRVLAALPDSAFFHYEGHIVPDLYLGWYAAMMTQLSPVTVMDIVTLVRVPRWVVMFGCNGALSGGDDRVIGLDLAHAFVAKGSQAVIAAVRPISDEDGAVLVSTLYAKLFPSDGRSAPPDLAVALREAQRVLKNRDIDWSALRVITP